MACSRAELQRTITHLTLQSGHASKPFSSILTTPVPSEALPKPLITHASNASAASDETPDLPLTLTQQATATLAPPRSPGEKGEKGEKKTLRGKAGKRDVPNVPFKWTLSGVATCVAQAETQWVEATARVGHCCHCCFER